MAALGLKEESQNRLVLETALGQRLGSLGNILVLLFVLFPVLSSFWKSFDLGDPLIIAVLLIVGFVALRTLYSILVSTRVVIDAAARQATRTTSLLVIPLKREELSLVNVGRVVVGSRLPVMFNQATARSVWQVALQPAQGNPLTVNSNGTHDEMLALGNKIGALINRPVVDELTRAGATNVAPQTEPIQDFSGGGTPSYAPPVAAPTRWGGRRPTSQLPPQEPLPNTLATDSESPEHARFEQEAMASAPEVADSTSSSGGPPASSPISPALGSGMPSMYSPPFPALGSAMPPASSIPSPSETGTPSYSTPPVEMGMPPLYSPPPAMDLPDQPPLGGPLNAPISVTDSSRTSPIQSPSESEGRPSPRAPARDWSFDELTKAIAADPNDSLMYYRLARLWQLRGGLNQALEAYQNSLHLDPLNAGMQNDLGLLYFQRGDFKGAENALRRASGLDPFTAAPHYNLGLLMLRTGRRAEAVQEFKRAAQNAASDAEQQRYINAQNGQVGGPMFSPQP